MPDLDKRARRLARKAGLVASKSRWRRGSVDNWGGFMLTEADRNVIVAGERFDLSAENVIAMVSRCPEAARSIGAR